MAFKATIDWERRAWICLSLATVMAAVAWFVPARWRSVHPAVLRAAGNNSAGLVETALQAAQQHRAGIATRLNEAATTLGLAGTNSVVAALAGQGSPTPELILLGGPDASLSALLPARVDGLSTNPVPALDAFLPAAHRANLRARSGESQTPGVQALLKTGDLPYEQFVPARQPGGQPLEAVVLLAATLYERERLSPTLASELRELAQRSSSDRAAQQRLEQFYLNLLSLSRRLDWTSLAELTRHVPNMAALERFTAAVRANPSDLSLLFASALLSGNAAEASRQITEHGQVGRQGLSQGLRDGAGAARWLAQMGLPVLPGIGCPAALAQAVQRAPKAWAYARLELFLVAAILVALSLRAFAQIGIPSSSAMSWTSNGSLFLVAILLVGFFVIASEPMPARPRKTPLPKIYLDSTVLTKSAGVTNPPHPQKNIMELSTLITLLVFGVIQLAVYVICVRKVNEITGLPEPPSVRLKLLENEDNLFDAGLYVGIGGTAAALVLQVLHLLEANLLAAYSSNLMGIICVALVKIGHVRQARRRLILESQAEAVDLPPDSGPVPAANPFTSR